MAQPEIIGLGFDETQIKVGPNIAYRITQEGIEPQPGFGGFKGTAGQTLSPRLFHSGGVPAKVNTEGTEKAGSAITMQLCEVYVPANCTVTGISLFNGGTPAGTIKVGLYDSTGKLIATNTSGAAGTTQAGGDAYQRIPFLAPVSIKGPATYFIGVACSTTSPINTHVFGDFGASEVAVVFATAMLTTSLVGVTMPSTFTTGVGPIASLY